MRAAKTNFLKSSTRYRNAVLGLALGVQALLQSGCSDKPSFVVLNVHDPDAVALDASELFFGVTPAALKQVDLNAGLTFPVQVTVTREKTGQTTLYVEARDSLGTTLARGSTNAILKSKGSRSAVVTLAKVCLADADCDDQVFCNGIEICADGICADGEASCGSAFECLVNECIEAAKQCAVTVSHGACPGDSYCDPGAGCVVGDRCGTDADCQDGSTCNGSERCINFHCVGGSSPTVDDTDDCTVDGCNDQRATSVFHVALVERDGNECVLPGTGGRGVCVAAKGGCSESICGDSVIDASNGEVCDEGGANNDAWSQSPTCTTNCAGWSSSCGDAVIDAGHETCDDGVRPDTGNGCSDTCQRNDLCGDGVVQSAFEQCDDGKNGDACDGCRDDCSRGCICATAQGCQNGERCDVGVCLACDVPQACGWTCDVCSGQTPACGGLNAGCVCSPDPAPYGSCGIGRYCDGSGSCSPCDTSSNCGQECTSCSGATPLCGGVEVGCITSSCAGQRDFTLCQVVTTPDRSYDVCIGEVCVSPGCGAETCNTAGPSYKLADTGQRLCYDGDFALGSCPSDPSLAACSTTPFCGQDAQYGWDTQNPASARYSRTETVAGEAMVSDNVTGLEWQGCAAGETGSDCSIGGASLMNHANAVAYCDALVWAGLADWHLPSVHELFSIANLARWNPGLDTAAFPSPSTYGALMASTSVAGGLNQAWHLDTTYGSYRTHLSNVSMPAMCVRHPTALQSWHATLAAVRFVKTAPTANQPVVADNTTNLMWQGCNAGRSGPTCATGGPSWRSFPAALDYCQDLVWSGFSDWRLPSAVEIGSIVDHRVSTASIDATFFPQTEPTRFWSSTTYVAQAPISWKVEFYRGPSYSNPKSLTSLVRCVR